MATCFLMLAHFVEIMKIVSILTYLKSKCETELMWNKKFSKIVIHWQLYLEPVAFRGRRISSLR